MGKILNFNQQYFYGKKHLETELHWIKRAVKNSYIQLQYCPTKEQLADLFTKALAHTLFIALISNFMFYFKV